MVQKKCGFNHRNPLRNEAVQDDGFGRVLEKLDDLTRWGFRLDESTPDSGLGLAVVHDIVISDGGTILFAQSA